MDGAAVALGAVVLRVQVRRVEVQDVGVGSSRISLRLPVVALGASAAQTAITVIVIAGTNQ